MSAAMEQKKKSISQLVSSSVTLVSESFSQSKSQLASSSVKSNQSVSLSARKLGRL